MSEQPYSIPGIDRPMQALPVTRCADYAAVSAASAETVRRCLAARPNAVLCLAAGNTAIGTYACLAQMQKKGEVDFTRARFVALDEWLGLPNHPENCTAFMRRHCYGPLGIRDEQIALYNTGNPDLDAECAKMRRHIQEVGGIDFVLLGIGMNGHLGLIEPGDDWQSDVMCVQLDPVTARVGQKYFSEGATLTGGITLGMQSLFAARKVVLQVSGETKADVVARLLQGPPSTDLPASALWLMENAGVIADEAALSKI